VSISSSWLGMGDAEAFDSFAIPTNREAERIY
jgi:hypothetical protein